MVQNPQFGPVMIDLEGLTLTAIEKDKIKHPNTGAIILFARNFHDPEQVSDLINDIRKTRRTGLLVAVDQEGGRVQRFQAGFTQLPAAASYADLSSAQEIAQTAGWLMASELLSVGVDFSFAPVLDVDSGISEIIADRSFSPDPKRASDLANSFRKGMRTAGMAAVGKHFPGHGAVAADSHLALPVDERDLDSIRQKDLLPFKHLINQGLEAVMPAHVIYSHINPLPAGFSPFWLQTILRQELNFSGAIFSDDMSMQGAAFAGGYLERAETALDAGCDMVLLCNNAAAAEQVLEQLPIKNNSTRNQRLINMTGQQLLSRTALLKNKHWQQSHSQLNHINEMRA